MKTFLAAAGATPTKAGGETLGAGAAWSPLGAPKADAPQAVALADLGAGVRAPARRSPPSGRREPPAPARRRAKPLRRAPPASAPATRRVARRPTRGARTAMRLRLSPRRRQEGARSRTARRLRWPRTSRPSRPARQRLRSLSCRWPICPPSSPIRRARYGARRRAQRRGRGGGPAGRAGGQGTAHRPGARRTRRDDAEAEARWRQALGDDLDRQPADAERHRGRPRR